MRIKVIGSSGSELPGYNLPCLLLDEFLLIDAGTIGLTLDKKEQKKITHILISHAHLDHIRGIPFFIDNLYMNRFKNPVTVISGRDVLLEIKKYIFNNRIWPDFTAIPSKEKPLLKLQPTKEKGFIKIKTYRIYSSRVSHSVKAYGYMIEDTEGNTLVYTGDTGPTEKLWKKMGFRNVKALIIEVSLPDSMRELALKSGHLTPSLLAVEMNKMRRIPEKIYVTHIKPQFEKTIERELRKIDTAPIEILGDKEIIEF